jgi:C4-dicarboxylate-specific signal transduction histidine kinase
VTASLAHEVNQPIAAAVTDANTCLRWLKRDHPDLEEAREAALRIVKDVTRASEIVSRIRVLFKKGLRNGSWLRLTRSFERWSLRCAARQRNTPYHSGWSRQQISPRTWEIACSYSRYS